MKIRQTNQNAMCDHCGRLLIPHQDWFLSFQSRKTGKVNVLVCGQCCQLAAILWRKWDRERMLP